MEVQHLPLHGRVQRPVGLRPGVVRRQGGVPDTSNLRLELQMNHRQNPNHVEGPFLLVKSYNYLPWVNAHLA